MAGGEDYEVRSLAEEAGITPEQARELVKRYGNDRVPVMEDASKLK